MRKSLELIAAADDLREGLRQRIAQLREGLATLPPELGWHLLPSHTAADVDELLAALGAHATDCVAALQQKAAGASAAPAAAIA